MNMDLEAMLNAGEMILALFVFGVLFYYTASSIGGSELNSDSLIKELAITADSMMNSEGEFRTNYHIDSSKFSVRADDSYIYVDYGEILKPYTAKYAYFPDKNYNLIFKFSKDDKDLLIMEKVKKSKEKTEDEKLAAELKSVNKELVLNQKEETKVVSKNE